MIKEHRKLEHSSLCTIRMYKKKVSYSLLYSIKVLLSLLSDYPKYLNIGRVIILKTLSKRILDLNPRHCCSVCYHKQSILPCIHAIKLSILSILWNLKCLTLARTFAQL
jgi:hypothetical protein